jgi:hypothetical protein
LVSDGLPRQSVEEVRSLDVNRLWRAGYLIEGRSGAWQWTQDGERVAWIGLSAGADHVLLRYRVRAPGEDWQDVSERVRIEHVPGRCGGARPYFICPGILNGILCGRRVAKLYGAGRYFLCRHCYRLTYESQREGKWDRLLRRADKIRVHLGGTAGRRLSPFPDRPKGMWRRTYQRLRQQVFEAELTADDAFDAWATELLERLEKRKSPS